MPNILIADDEALIRAVLTRELQSIDYTVDTACDGKEALEKILSRPYDLVILDNQMPAMKGLEVLRQVRLKKRNIKIIILTAYGTIANAVEAMKLGAYDYATKPFENDELIRKIRLAVEQESSQNAPAPEQTLIWESPAFAAVLETARQVRNIQSTVLITGESGTGKGLIARHIHDTGVGAGKPFVHVNCAVLPSTLIDSELFGHAAGAFTGASKDKKGKFEAARDGTIFLDEIAMLTPDLQAKLLTVLQERTFEKVGSNKTQKLHARVITATNEELPELVRRGDFRKDLYYRLNVVSIHCPPLHQRKEDIEPLANNFLSRYNQLYQRNVAITQPDTWAYMKRYSWPGNVRELENFIERIVAMNIPEERSIQDILRSFEEDETRERPAAAEESPSLKEQEYRAILAALAKHNGHREKTAQELGISRRALQYKLKEYKLTRNETS